MTDRKRITLSELARKAIANEEFPEIGEEAFQSSDRTAAIVLASGVERILEQSIIAVLPRHDDRTVERLLGRDGPLDSFYGKNQLGYALGIYGGTALKNLEAVRKIRNAFAHSPLKINFETAQVVEEAQKIKMEPLDMGELSHLSDSRQKYSAFCSLFMIVFLFKARGHSLDKLIEVLDAVLALRKEGKGNWPQARKNLVAIVAAGKHLEDN
jgi:DNA-binding MltR family transcriptional regulator